MADKPRTFVKKGPDGKTLTREVTGPASEVEAIYDGYKEKSAGGSKPHTTGSSTSS